MIRVYLSGQISGLPHDVSKRNFDKAHRSAIKYYTKVHGLYEVDIQIINPHKIKPFAGIKSWYFFMISDLKVIKTCHEIYHLDDWVVSPGASIEHYVGIRRKLKIRYHHRCKAELKQYYIKQESEKIKST